MKNNVDVIIIGSGLFGSMTAKYLKNKGLDVMIIDHVDPFSASKCSFGIWKTGWINKSIKNEVEQSLPLLKKMFEIVEIPFFNMDKEKEEKMMWLDCRQILNEKFNYYSVENISNNIVSCINLHTGLSLKVIAKKAVVVCAGVWTGELLRKSNYNFLNLEWNWGATLEIKGKLDVSRINTWAPYKQNVLLKIDDNHFVFGDGATVKNPKQNDKRLEKASTRLLEHASDTIGTLNHDTITAVNEGYRPYLGKGNGNFINRHDKNLFSATGGAKNSTILCGFIAKQIFHLIKENDKN